MNWLTPDFTRTKRSARQRAAAAFTLAFAAAFGCVSCTVGKADPVIVWTNRQELVSYAELFNSVQNETKVFIVYKDAPVESIPPAKDEPSPDIVVGPWLKNEKVRKNFRPLDYMFSEQRVNQATFYPQLLNSGNVNDKQYLFPLSFNLPAVIFANGNRKYVDENYILSLDQIRDKAAAFNAKNKSGIYTSMGFAPRWNPDFLYLAAKIKQCGFREKNELFSWNELKLAETMNYLKNWTTAANGSTAEERDFEFKYLYTPEYKQVTAGSCLFAYVTSDELFTIPAERLQEIDFRWIHENYRIPVEDSLIYLGLYKKARNPDGAEAFISWLLKEPTQKLLLDRTAEMNLNTTTFGIAGGFSSIKSVNERVFPLYYRTLLDNMPAAEYLTPPNPLPPRWKSLKERVVVPWLEDASDTKNETPPKSMDALISEWSKQYY
ncbi:extracellular solute-binding protein [Treponema brennaborense]|uniref:Lipoprotein n=1 Tax=Treponema brennaborense (strain DSM 12168 / CIP 105900 / DD5/3) TaxID=906968 RepID=F4LK53_TREBD|nr:extracellular solute-binding protein [Treponema brennaborense]AEE17515.1 putative lipoprotein [Treponema brennaborense DSM 12168]